MFEQPPVAPRTLGAEDMAEFLYVFALDLIENKICMASWTLTLAVIIVFMICGSDVCRTHMGNLPNVSFQTMNGKYVLRLSIAFHVFIINFQ